MLSSSLISFKSNEMHVSPLPAKDSTLPDALRYSTVGYLDHFNVFRDMYRIEFYDP